jgi:hypothetical protein
MLVVVMWHLYPQISQMTQIPGAWRNTDYTDGAVRAITPIAAKRGAISPVAPHL